MSITGIKMYRWISEVTREDRIRNKYVRACINVALIMDEMIENKLFWYVMRRRKAKSVRAVMKNNVK